MNLYRRHILLAGVLLLAMLVAGSHWMSAQASGTAYYVDCSASSNGDGINEPWNNLGSVNDTNFDPGNSILFKRGTTCYGQLKPQGSGDDGSPITIGAYGTGDLPQIDYEIDCNIDDSLERNAALYLFNQEYWEIENLEIIGGTSTCDTSAEDPDPDKPPFPNFGILVSGDGGDMLHHIHITNVVVHDVWGGRMSEKTSGLVVLGYNWTQQFEDVLIDGVTAYNTDKWAGIVVTGKGYKWQTTRSDNVVIRNNTVYNTYGDGIIVFSAENVLIEHNVAHDTGNEPVESIGTPNSIWTWDCSDCVVQFNEAYLASSPSWDGGAYDIDYYSSRTTVQYNYGHDNDAYCLAIFSTDGILEDNTIRYNICSNNGRNGELAPDRNADMYYAVWEFGEIADSKVYNNTFYWNPANKKDHFAVAGFDLWKRCCFTGSNWFVNNIIYSESPNLVHMGLNENISMDHNLYWYTGTDDPVFRWGFFIYKGFEAFKLGSGQEEHGIYANPLLTDPAYSRVGFPVSAFTLQEDSPAIEAGVNLEDPVDYVTDMGEQDFFGNEIPYNGGAYDIGAHEFSGAPVPTPPDKPGGRKIVHIEELYTTNAAGLPMDEFSAGAKVFFRVLVQNEDGFPVNKADVSAEILGPDSGTVWALNEKTGSDGWAYFIQETDTQTPTGLYTIQITEVVLGGRDYGLSEYANNSHLFTLK